MLKKVAVNLGLLVGALGIGVLLAEGAVRLFAPQETMFPRWIDSPEYPIALPPNATVVHRRGNIWHFEYTTNQLGRRGPYVPPTPDGTTRVVSLGDSFTFGSGVNDDEVYTHVLSDLLGPGYRVVNGGMGGFGIDSEIKWFFSEGAAHDPRIVTLQFAANDPSDFFGVTRLEGSEFTFHPNPNIRPAWQLLLSKSAIIQKSHLYVFLRALYGRSTARGRVGGSTEAAEQAYARLLRQFASALQQRGSVLLFVSVTHRERPDGTYHYDIDDFPTIRAAVDSLDSEGLLRFVPLPVQEMGGYPPSPEGHNWAAEHHRLVAEAIAKEIALVEGNEAP